MSLRSAMLPAAMLCLVGLHAIASPDTPAALGGPANQIVGLWRTAAEVGPCGGPPTMQVRNYLLFHAGGTVTENISPSTIRNTGLGTWSYDSRTKEHRLRLRFDRFANGAYIGYSTIDRQLVMSPDGLEVSGEVHVTLYAVDDSLVQELCGDATSTRVL